MYEGAGGVGSKIPNKLTTWFMDDALDFEALASVRTHFMCGTYAAAEFLKYWQNLKYDIALCGREKTKKKRTLE